MDWRRRRRPTRSTHSVPIIGATNEAELRRRESGRGHGCMPCMHARAADGIDAAGANVGLSSRYSVSSLCDVLLRGLPPTSVGLLYSTTNQPRAIAIYWRRRPSMGERIEIAIDLEAAARGKKWVISRCPLSAHCGKTGRAVRPSGWERKRWVWICGIFLRRHCTPHAKQTQQFSHNLGGA